ncbi:Uncharacterised protein [Serratia entomophila]|uniref:hypothetical protein n=1 Tax=Serratia entomophila TaxID=42906 RepID=UPI002179E3F3|nr:hypothetical protein [Serratia entomophila]CAI0754005.1 Uncharacterised protein [Serratia entomophila]CAI0766509.1 Uncharacterised protein [Serratia entomophila]CAI2068322.1 Uncharacterised protein [Serratia entomophila]
MTKSITPGYCIVEQPGPLAFQAQTLFNGRSNNASRYFMTLNADSAWLKPGQILLVADPENALTPNTLRLLRLAKQNVNRTIAPMSTDDAGFMQKNYGAIAALTSVGDKLFGTASDVGEKYFRQIESTLQKIEKSYQSQYRSQGSLISQQFYAERAALFTELRGMVNKPILARLTQKTLKLKHYEDMRHALNLSSKSIVHEWSTAGVGAIKGYSTYLDGASRAATFMKSGGYIAIAFSGLNATNEVMNACTTGREMDCPKVAVKEYSKFGFSTGGAILGGSGGAMLVGGICVVAGIATGGAAAFACGLVGSLGRGLLGGAAGEQVGAKFGDGVNTLFLN